MILKEGLGASGTTDWFMNNSPEQFEIEMLSGGGSGFNAGTITMQTRDKFGDSARTHVIDGANETWSAADKRRYEEAGEFRFSADASISDVDITIRGGSVTILPR